MAIEKVEMFQTSDGELFKSKLEAELHESNNEVWDAAIAEYGRYDELTFPYKSDLLEFLTNHRVKILKHLGVYVK